MSGMLLSVLGARVAERPWQWKLPMAFGVSAACAALAAVMHRFWIVGKIEATPVWVFYVIAIAVMLYAVLDCLVQAGATRWFAIIKPAGTSTLTTYLMPYVFYAMSSLTGVVLPDCLTHGAMGIVNCLTFALVVIAVTGVLERINIKLKL